MSTWRYFIRLAYNGTFYRGSAKQSGRYSVLDIDSVQGILEAATRCLQPLPKHANIYLGSRTDRGVHALDAIGQLKIETNLDYYYDSNKLVEFLNKFLSRTRNHVRILECVPVSEYFHIRDVIKSRTYIYRIMIPKDINDYCQPMLEVERTHCLRINNSGLERMERAMQLFMGRKNFKTFAASKPTRFPIVFERSLNELRLEKAQPLVAFDKLSDKFNYWNIVCNSRSFLYQQVRRILGTLFALAQGDITEKDINIMLTVPSHAHFERVKPAPASALYLAKTVCDEDLLNKWRLNSKNFKNISTNLVAE